MRTLVVAAMFLASAGSASAQSLKLEFQDGRVSIDAASVPVRTILSEWARLGGTKVVGGDRVAGAPLTIKLENVPESQALEVVLRNVAGYMAAPRQADATGASLYDRILVMPTSSAPPANAANTGNNLNGNGLAGRAPRGPFNPPPPGEQDADEPPPPDPADTGINEPPFSFPQQNPFQPAGQATPFGTPMAPGEQPPVINFGQPAQQGVTINPMPEQPMPVMQFPGMPPQGATPSGGFGIVGAPTPGVVVQPATPQPGRPPGGDR